MFKVKRKKYLLHWYWVRDLPTERKSNVSPLPGLSRAQGGREGPAAAPRTGQRGFPWVSALLAAGTNKLRILNRELLTLKFRGR